MTGSPVPLPDPARATVAIPAPGRGTGSWAGGPSAAVAPDGTVWLAYRLRRPVGAGRGYAVGIARSTDGGRTFTEAHRIERTAFACDSLERPSLVLLPEGGWRLYLSLATPGTLHWYVVAIDADHPTEFLPSRARVTLQDGPHRALKDTVVRHGPEGWEVWACLHQVGDPAEADAMTTLHGTSPDGLRWTLDPAPALAPVDSEGWDRRGTRVTAVLPTAGGGRAAFYDGRASYAENWEERTGLAVEGPGHRLRALPTGPISAPHGSGCLRYLDAIEVAEGWRYYYELAGPSGAHDLVTELVDPPS